MNYHSSISFFGKKDALCICDISILPVMIILNINYFNSIVFLKIHCCNYFSNILNKYRI